MDLYDREKNTGNNKYMGKEKRLFFFLFLRALKDNRLIKAKITRSYCIVYNLCKKKKKKTKVEENNCMRMEEGK